MPDDNIIIKYRPTSFEEVIGHDSVIKSLKKILQKKSAKNFLFYGPSGVGKTTISRIIARELGAERQNILEIDAATYSGVDSIREITSKLSFCAFGQNPVRVIIIDECHALSKSSWQALLRSIEEPDTETYWIFCTTEHEKVPKTIKTRCAVYGLSEVPDDEIYLLLKTVSELEEYDIKEEILRLIVRESFGSPRQALSYLAVCGQCKTRSEAASLIKSADESNSAINICRLLVNKKNLSWKKLIEEYEKISDIDPESIRIMIRRYVAKVARKSSSENQVLWCLYLLECFRDPLPYQDKASELVLMFGKAVYEDHLQ